MRRVLLSFATVLAVLILGFGGSLSASAQANGQPTPANYTIGALLRVKLTIAYAWLRGAPSSNGAIIDTAQRSEFVIIASPAPSWDGSQWWWAVRRANGNATGWIEQNSIEAATAPGTATNGVQPTAIPGVTITATAAPSQTPQTWAADTTLGLAAGVPFAWLRDNPASNAAVRATVYPGAVLIVQSGTTLPVSDGSQNWWLVSAPSLNRIGWVEQKSLVQITVTPTSAATQAPTVGTPAMTNTPLSQAEKWAVGTTLKLKLGVPFVWLRITAQSFASWRGVVTPGATLTVRDATPVFDGTQYWWLVNYSVLNLYGYVEQNSLEVTAAATATVLPGSNPAGWATGSLVLIKAGVPFVWVRRAPSSYAGVVADVSANVFTVMQIRGGAQWDGVQWWWPVQVAFTNVGGWVEQNSMVLLTPPATATIGAKLPATVDASSGATNGPLPTATPTQAG